MSKAARKQQKNLIHNIASQRMWRLFELAQQEFAEHPERSERYVQLIRNISMRNRMNIPREIKRRICKHCYSFLVPGSNARYRLKGGYIVISCKRCGKEIRYPYKIAKNKKNKPENQGNPKLVE
jgi:ribonuclease P protein subunit RPR2